MDGTISLEHWHRCLFSNSAPFHIVICLSTTSPNKDRTIDFLCRTGMPENVRDSILTYSNCGEFQNIQNDGTLSNKAALQKAHQDNYYCNKVESKYPSAHSYVLLLNSGALISWGSIDALYRASVIRPDAAGISAVFRNGKDRIVPPKKYWKNLSFLKFLSNLVSRRSEDLISTNNVYEDAVLVRKDAFYAIFELPTSVIKMPIFKTIITFGDVICVRSAQIITLSGSGWAVIPPILNGLCCASRELVSRAVWISCIRGAAKLPWLSVRRRKKCATEPEKDRKVILVVGPGRSGTSAITRGLMVLGVDLGTNLMPAQTGVNNKGFWEDLDIYGLNLEVFEEVKSTWHSLAPIDIANAQTGKIEELSLKAVGILQRKMANTFLFGLKDPQITRILPFWIDIIGRISASAYFLIACRNPLSVARSLSQYTGLEMEQCFAIWFQFTLDSLQKTPPSHRLVVSYEGLMENPGTQLKRISKLLGLEFDEFGEIFNEYALDFLDVDLQHNFSDLEQLRKTPEIPSKVYRLYELMLRFAEDSLPIDSAEAAREIDAFR